MKTNSVLLQIAALTVCAAIFTSGCAAATHGTMTTPAAPVNTATMADYVQRIATGSKVRVERTDGGSLKGTLMKATPEAITVQRNSRLPEPPIDIPISSIARVTLETSGGTSTGKAIAIGIASGVGTFLGILAIIAATFND